MGQDNLNTLGKMEAIAALYEGTPFKPLGSSRFETEGKSLVTMASRTLLEGMDFDLTYFPLKHLGYKSVITVTGELYAQLSHPKALNLRMGVSSKLDFTHIGMIWEGVVKAAQEHSYTQLSLDLEPSLSGLSLSLSAMGETSLLTEKRRMPLKSMDLICISDNLGAAFIGQTVLENEKKNFADNKKQPQLEEYKNFVAEYLRPTLPAGILKELEQSGIYPKQGYLVDKGLADAVRRLVRDSGLGAKIYVDRLPFAGGSFDMGKKFNFDPVSAAMNGGEDYRLLFSIPMSVAEKFRCDFQTFDIIGHMALAEVGAVLVTPDGLEHPIHAQGWNNETE